MAPRKSRGNSNPLAGDGDGSGSAPDGSTGSDSGGDGGALDPAAALAAAGGGGSAPVGGGDNPPERAKRKYTKRNGGNGTVTTASGQVDLSFTSATLHSIHMLLAARIPELAITEDEATKLAEAINGVQRAYHVQVDPKVAVLVNLGLVGASIYGTRIGAIIVAKRDANKPQE